MWSPRIALALAFLSVAVVVPALPDDPTHLFCTDVLTIPRRSLLLAWKLRNNPDILLDNQRVCTTEEPFPGVAKCDWEYDLSDVAVLRPEAGTVLRLVSTVRTHMTGTGSHATLEALECRQSRLVGLFTAGGGELQQVSPSTFVVASAVWVGQDATCCPSHERHTRFEWDKDRHTYRPTGETFFRVDSTTRKRTQVVKPDEIE